MNKSDRKKRTPKRVMRLPDLDFAKRSVLYTLGSPASKQAYEFGIDDFVAWATPILDVKGRSLLAGAGHFTGMSAAVAPLRSRPRPESLAARSGGARRSGRPSDGATPGVGRRVSGLESPTRQFHAHFVNGLPPEIVGKLRTQATRWE